ncbi:MAG TPA: YndJ family protein [Pirellulaceae bacterium]|nr:YndJ family protein [Pirellulaceae bacterium]
MTHELWARFILMLGAAVVVPLGLECGMRSNKCGVSAIRRRPALFIFMIAALLLGAGQLLPQGFWAATMSAPWLLVTCAIAVAGLASAWQHRRGPVGRLVCAGGMIYLAIGGGWVLVERAGIRPLDFDPAIVLLTGIHFHYAGFALPILAGMAIGRLPGMLSNVVALGVIASVPLVAVGITATQLGFAPVIEMIAAWCMSLSGLGVAWLYFRLAVQQTTNPVARQLWSFGALFLTAGMLLSILYGSRSLIPLPWLDIPWMRAWHGTANALGFTIPALLGWRWHVAR